MLGRNALAAFAVVLIPAGPVTDLVKNQSVWRGFIQKDPVLGVARVEKIKGEGTSCDDWNESLKNLPVLATRVGAKPTDEEWAKAFRAWEPLTENDLDMIRGCDEFPCKVKLDASEVGKMAAAPESKRKEAFYGIVEARGRRYLKTQARKEYEFPGDPVDPWGWFAKQGFASKELKTPEGPQLGFRRLLFASDQMKPIHQILDQRYARSGNQSALWIRDVYTDHFFDSWGEWAHVDCDPTTLEVIVTQGLMLEVDLLKKNDVFSRLGRGKLRSAVKEQGGEYLDRAMRALKKGARKKGKA